MNRKIVFTTVILLVISLFSPQVSRAAESNAGFIPAPIWFSVDTLSVGITTKVSTLVYNSTSDAISMTVTFYDGDIVLGKKAAIVSAQSSKEFSIDWKVTVGDHAIRAHIENPRKGTAQGSALSLSSTDTDAYRFTVLADLGAHPFSPADSPLNETTPASNPASAVEEDKKAVIVGATTAFNQFDDFRVSTAKGIQTSLAAAEKIVAQDPKTASQGGEVKSTGTERPFAYVKLFFLRILSFIFGNAALFYGLIILIIILFVRYLIRAPR